MSWSRRAVLLSGLAFVVTACVEGGYQPVNAPGAAANALRQGSLRIAAPSDEDGYHFVARLEQRFGQASRNPLFDLDYTLTVGEEPVGVRPDQATQRFNVIGRLDYRVSSVATGAVLTSGGFESFSSYSATDGAISGLSAQENAHQRLMILLADQLVTRLNAGASTWAAPQTKGARAQ